MTATPLRALCGLIVSAALLTRATALAQEATESNTDDASQRLESVQNPEPSFLVRAEVNRKSHRYREGDDLVATAASEVDGYLYALYKQADGQIYQIFPNSGQKNNRVRARQPVMLPASQDHFRWRISAPFGKEVLKIIVSKEPITGLSDPELCRRLFNPVDDKCLKGMGVEINEFDPSKWATFDIQLETVPSDARAGQSGEKRIGVFFGVSHYEFNAEAELASSHGRGLNLPTCHRDANQLAELMRDEGRLDDAQVYTNENATRENLEEAITGWLRESTQPGDTVFIYFSGHGMQIADNNNDESDERDEVLTPYGSAGPSILNQLLKLHRQGNLETSRQVRLQELLEVAGVSNSRDRPTNIEEIGQRLARGTGVSDDLMGHWLQTLDGRKIVVILDICFAGGFATLEKGFHDSQTGEFDFLDRELARLKDIGQENTLLLASSNSDTPSQCRSDQFPQTHGPLSVMTSYLIELLLVGDGRCSMEDALGHCQSGMQDYFNRHTQKEPHRPVLFGETAAPVYIKP